MAGDDRAANELLPLVYDKLRTLAQSYMKQERGYQTLQPTAVVHEAYLRLIRYDRIDWQGKTHFFAIAATEMRRVLVDHARANQTVKRGAGVIKIVHDDNSASRDVSLVELIALDQALTRLDRENPRQSRIVEMRLFAGMLVPEIAKTLDISPTTVKQDWRVARAWLAAELG